MNKRRAPYKQLMKAGKIANDELVKRGVLSSDNLVAELIRHNPKTLLPGIPSYLPHKWTVRSAQRLMYDLLRLWQYETKDPKQQDNLTMFIEFSIKEMKIQEDRAKKKMDMMPTLFMGMKDVPVLGEIFAPVNQYETTKAMTKFFVDCFAVSVIVNGEVSTTTEFTKWFLKWSNDLYTMWDKKDVKSKK